MTGRPEHERWQHFEKAPIGIGKKTKRARCRYCKSTVSATSRNMDAHLRNCSKVKRTLGALVDEINIADQGSQTTANNSNSNGNQLSTSSSVNKIGPLSSLIIRSTSEEERMKIDNLFSIAVHTNATPFSFFDEQEWFDFFNALNGSWKVPSPEIIGGDFLDNAYKSSMQAIIDEVKRKGSGTVGVDGATSRLSKSISNFIIHLPHPFFVEYRESDLQRETSLNAVSYTHLTLPTIYSV